MAYPVTYDTKANLFGDLANQRTLTLATALTDTVGTSVYFLETVNDMGVPVYIRFTTGELVKATANLGATGFTVVRGFGGTTAATHLVGEVAYVVLAGEHFNILRDALLNLQKYRALRLASIGDFTALLADSKEGKIAVSGHLGDPQVKIRMNSTSVDFSGLGIHDRYTDLGADDHYSVSNPDPTENLLNSDRLLTFHNNTSNFPGNHVTDGDNHTHQYGTGIKRVRAGVDSSKPTASAAGLGGVYYSTDLKELYVSDGATWFKITGAPAGTIIMFTTGSTCPEGWSRFTAMDGRFPKGALANSVPGANGGVSSHLHTYSGVPNHGHTVGAQAVTTSTNGSHSHSFPKTVSSGGSGVRSSTYGGSNNYGTSGGGNHAHGFTIPATTTGSAGSAGPQNTGSQTNLPIYTDLLFCIKD